MGCKRYDGCIICVLFQISWHLQTQIVKNRILSDSLLGNKLYLVTTAELALYLIPFKHHDRIHLLFHIIYHVGVLTNILTHMVIGTFNQLLGTF